VAGHFNRAERSERSTGRRVAVRIVQHAPSHRASAWRSWFGRGRTRALLSLGTLLALGAVGTAAAWTDTAQVDAGAIASGSMDLQVAQTTAGPWSAVGTDAAYAATHVTISNLTPSEAYAFPLAVRNVGAADFTYTATVRQGASPAWSFVGDPITVQLFAGTANTTDATYPVQQACGGTALAPAATVVVGATTVVTTPRRVNKGASDSQLCLLVTMVTSADNANQGKQGQLRLDLTATQVTS
jgi:predicted ribosomally synthesized peptide with SipW-like signal peptide